MSLKKQAYPLAYKQMEKESSSYGKNNRQYIQNQTVLKNNQLKQVEKSTFSVAKPSYEQVESDLLCPRCNQSELNYVQLQCSHIFCSVCIAFMWTKYRLQTGADDQIKCLTCNQICTLSPPELELIHQTLEARVIPFVDQENCLNLSTLNSAANANAYERLFQNKRSQISEVQKSKRNSNSQHSENSQGILNPANEGYLLQSEKTTNKKMRSQEHSPNDTANLKTPSTEVFFSKGGSPKNRHVFNYLNRANINQKQNQYESYEVDEEKPKWKEYCPYHQKNQANFLCFTCNNQLLCIKCINSKQHNHHQVKGLKNGYDHLTEKIQMDILETKYKIGYVEMWERRLQHSKGVIEERGRKSLYEIEKNFQQIHNKLRDKQNQILHSCQNHYESIFNFVEEEKYRIEEMLIRLRSHCDKLTAVVDLSSPNLFINEFNKLKDELNFLDEQNNYGCLNAMSVEPKILQKFAYEEAHLCKEMMEVESSINRIKLDFKDPAYVNHNIHPFTPVSKPYTYTQQHVVSLPQTAKGNSKNTLEKSKSDKKIKKDETSKRVKTNFASLNSSRDKKDMNIKCAKTQEDQCRIIRNGKNLVKNFIAAGNYGNFQSNMASSLGGTGLMNVKNFASSIPQSHLHSHKNQPQAYSKELPSYIQKFFDKQNVKQEAVNINNGGGVSCVYDYQNSKISPKILSKTLMPQQVQKRKRKEHISIAKNRVQRKTVNINLSNNPKAKSEHPKKRKAHN